MDSQQIDIDRNFKVEVLKTKSRFVVLQMYLNGMKVGEPTRVYAGDVIEMSAGFSINFTDPYG